VKLLQDTPPAIAPVLISSNDAAQPLAYSPPELARALGLSLSGVEKLNRAGRLPLPIRLGRSVRWPADEIRAWLAAGCPERARWAAIKGAR
jgi:excisionase family DNA binding protein